MGALQFALLAPFLIFAFWQSSQVLLKTSCRSQALKEKVFRELDNTVSNSRFKIPVRGGLGCLLFRRGAGLQVDFSLPTRVDYE